MIQIVLIAITVLALIAVLFFGTGGRAWFGTHEMPDRIIGRRVQFLNIDWLGATPPSLPSGKVEAFEKPFYRIVLDTPYENEGISERLVTVAARSRGWPVSDAARKPTAVLARLESGQGFWADLKVTG